MDQGYKCLHAHLALISAAIHLSHHSGQCPHILGQKKQAVTWFLKQLLCWLVKIVIFFFLQPGLTLGLGCLCNPLILVAVFPSFVVSTKIEGVEEEGDTCSSALLFMKFLPAGGHWRLKPGSSPMVTDATASPPIVLHCLLDHQLVLCIILLCQC